MALLKEHVGNIRQMLHILSNLEQSKREFAPLLEARKYRYEGRGREKERGVGEERGRGEEGGG
jgi:hypothetical protein